LKAVRLNAFGGLEALQLEDVARPVPAADEILVKVYASGVNDALRAYLTLPLTPG
jgi:NADPH:quinone reductase-like Zn-dependent oxidoreductase